MLYSIIKEFKIYLDIKKKYLNNNNRRNSIEENNY